MVARFISGKSIKGALRYNEEKVQKGKAKCIAAVGYPADNGQLNFAQKLARLENLAALNDRVKVNCIHVSLNLDPSEILSDDKLLQIADAYIGRTGFEGQPYLVYRHFDAAHPHIHIVTTNIQPDGKRIALHNIGRNQSENARKEIEKMFGLVPAESKKKKQEVYLKPVAISKAVYGKSETKSAVSNIVREVIRCWKFTSLAEYNAILKRYNITADNGKDGSRMREKEGLVYRILDNKGEPVGVPIKASSIYTKPTLAKLKDYFEQSREQRKPYAYRIKNYIDKAIESDGVCDRSELKKFLEKESILVIYRENTEGKTYGTTFLDLKAKVVFNGSDLGKAYSISNLLKRLDPEYKAAHHYFKEDERRIEEVLREINFAKGFASVLAQLYAKGIAISRQENEEGEVVFFLSSRLAQGTNLIPADSKLTAYLLANGYSGNIETRLQERLSSYSAILPSLAFMESWIAGLLKSEEEHDHHPIRQKKKKRKPNW